MIFPTLHMNGTSKQELLTQFANAYKAVNAALAAMAQATPHQRDYYMHDISVYRTARAEHEIRCAKLIAVRDEYMLMGQEIQK